MTKQKAWDQQLYFPTSKPWPNMPLKLKETYDLMFYRLLEKKEMWLCMGMLFEFEVYKLCYIYFMELIMITSYNVNRIINKILIN